MRALHSCPPGFAGPRAGTHPFGFAGPWAGYAARNAPVER